MERGFHARSPSSQGWQQSEAFQTPSQRADDNEQMSSGSTPTPIRSSVDREIWPVSYATFHATTTAYPLPPSKGIRCNKHNRCCFSFSVEHGVTFIIELWVGDIIKICFTFTDKDKVGIRVK